MKPQLLTPNWSDLPHVEVFSSTREGGTSEGSFASFNLATHVDDDEELVLRNRALLRKALSGEPDLQWLEQVHGTKVTTVDGESFSELPLTADGVVTSAPSIVCCVLTADCLPVILVSETRREVAAVHAGWRGLAAGIVEQAISKMATPGNELRAWLGPCIGPCHFEVGAEVREAFFNSSPDIECDSCFTPASESGKFMADLAGLARLKLEAAGLKRIDSCDVCSHCDTRRCYSYRREARTGRNATGVYLLPIT